MVTEMSRPDPPIPHWICCLCMGGKYGKQPPNSARKLGPNTHIAKPPNLGQTRNIESPDARACLARSRYHYLLFRSLVQLQADTNSLSAVARWRTLYRDKCLLDLVQSMDGSVPRPSGYRPHCQGREGPHGPETLLVVGSCIGTSASSFMPGPSLRAVRLLV